MDKIIAFDFAGSGIRALAAESLPDNSLRILSEEVKTAEGIKNGIIGQPSGTAFTVTTLWKVLNNSAGLKDQLTTFSTSLGGKSLRIVHATIEKRLNRMKAISEELIDSMALECEKSYSQPDMMVYDIIPVSYEIDDQLYEKPEGHKGNYILGTYHLVVGSSQIKEQLDKCMERIAICNIEYMPLSAEAFSTVVTEEEERTNGCAIINLGETSTTLAIYKNQILQHLLVVPLGGRNITKDIEEIGISEDHAERLKCLKGTSLEYLIDKPVNIKLPAKERGAEPIVVSNKFLALIIEARLDEMFDPIFEMCKKADLPHGIVLTGGGSNLNMIREYVEEKSGIATRNGDHSEWLSPDTPEKFRDPRYAQLIGVILLTHSNREENYKPPLSETGGTKKKSGKRKSIKEKITQGFIKFFEDDTDLPGGNG